MSEKLTVKQEEFCRCIALERLSQRQAYIKAYGRGNRTDKSLDENASRVSRNVKVVSRIKELQDSVAEKAIWSKVDMINDLREIAMECKGTLGMLAELNGEKVQIVDTKARAVAINAIKAAGEFLGYKAAEVHEVDAKLVVEFNIPRPARKKNDAEN